MDYAQLTKTLLKHHYQVSVFSNKQQVVEFFNSKLINKTIGFGDSLTLLQLDLENELIKNNTVYNPFNTKTNDEFIKVAKQSINTDVFITSVNALSLNGELVSMDGSGNRLAGSLFNHEIVYFVISKNKIVENLEDAIYRTRNIAAPLNNKRLQTLNPCAREGKKCYDCSSPYRICNALLILFNKMDDIDMHIILIDEELGY